MDRLALERHQVWLYLAAIVAGLVVGGLWPGLKPAFEAALWPVLAALLYVTFVQVPLLHVRAAFADRRFVAALLLGNFVLLPLLVWALLAALPQDTALRLGVALVLLVPCTDWFITFSHLGRGDAARAIAVTPLNLLAQLVLLPVYLGLMLPLGELTAAWRRDGLLSAALALIGLPLLLAALTERWLESDRARAPWRERLAWWPVPLLAGVVFLIAAAQVGTVRSAGSELLAVLPAFLAFLLAAALIARLLTGWFGLQLAAGRTLAFSFGTRNSFLVLPLALTLPPGWETAVVVIVLQSLVELFGMVFYLWWLPARLFPASPR
ncbi:MAG: arsenic resistance protein [Thiobacillaceae bacterium]|nr:arsenic resistance protein [Thiobacillaceae bacterium]